MTENPEQAHPQIPSPQDTGDKTRSSAAGHVGRRAVLGGGLAVAGIGPLTAFAASTAEAAPTSPGHDSSRHVGPLQRVTGHALYLLPQDHKWHTGGIFDSGQLQEWHY